MARKKVKLQWIVNDTARKATYKKRVKGLMKKVKELSILCDVSACAITYSPYHQKPEIWPAPSEVERVLAEFKSRPENDQTKKVLNQENFTWQRITKARDELGKQQKKNRKTQIEYLRTQCLIGKPMEGLDSRDLGDLMWAVDDQLEAVKHRMSLLPRPQQAAGAGGSSTAGNAGHGVGSAGMDVSHVAAGPQRIGLFSGVADAPPYTAALPVSGIGLPPDHLHVVGGAGAGAGGVPSLPFSSGSAAGAAPFGSSSAAAVGAAQKSSFEMAIEALENQILMEQNQQIQNENMVTFPGEQEMLPLDQYDVYSFWRNPYLR